MPDPSEMESMQQEMADMRARLEELERTNRNMRKMLGPMWVDPKPGFDMLEFAKALRFYLLMYMLPIVILVQLMVPLFLMLKPPLPVFDVLPNFPLFDLGYQPTRHPGMGFGVFAFGGVAAGCVAAGGGAVGIIAIGGGSFGLIAIGGGSVGFIAIGGGSIGYIAMAGGAVGVYVLAGDGRGKYVLSRRRQDPEAVEFFTKLFPRLKKAFTSPMPVQLVE